MFDFSLAEFGVVSIISLIVLGPQELIKLIKTIKKVITPIKKIYKKYLTEITSHLNEEELEETVFDPKGKAYKAYNLKKVNSIIKGINRAKKK